MTVPAIGSPAPDFTLAVDLRGRMSRCRASAAASTSCWPFSRRPSPASARRRLCAFSEDYSRFTSADTVVLPISVDWIPALKAFKAHEQMTVDLLSDSKREVVAAYGVYLDEAFVVEARVHPDRQGRHGAVDPRRVRARSLAARTRTARAARGARVTASGPRRLAAPAGRARGGVVLTGCQLEVRPPSGSRRDDAAMQGAVDGFYRALAARDTAALERVAFTGGSALLDATGRDVTLVPMLALLRRAGAPHDRHGAAAGAHRIAGGRQHGRGTGRSHGASGRRRRRGGSERPADPRSPRRDVADRAHPVRRMADPVGTLTDAAPLLRAAARRRGGRCARARRGRHLRQPPARALRTSAQHPAGR